MMIIKIKNLLLKMADRPPNGGVKLKIRYNDENNVNRQLPIKITTATVPTLTQRPALRDVNNKFEQNKPNIVVKNNNNQPPVEKSKIPLKKTDSKPDLKVKQIEEETTDVEEQVAIIDKPIETLLTINDHDINDRNNPELVTEYIYDIYQYWIELEDRYQIRGDFLKGHKCSPEMRAILVNWLIEVQIDWNYHLQTLYMCISLVDRYLQDHKEVGRDTLQLLGVTALMIATKYEEVDIYVVKEFVAITDRAFSKRQILQFEKRMLSSFNFNLSTPSPLEFLRRYAKIGQIKQEQYVLAKYFLELSLLDYTFSSIKSSILSASACCLSIALWDEVYDPSKVWTPTLNYYSGYKYDDLKSTIVAFANLIKRADGMKRQAVQKKYAAAKYYKISTNARLKGRLIRRLTSETPKRGS